MLIFVISITKQSNETDTIEKSVYEVLLLEIWGYVFFFSLLSLFHVHRNVNVDLSIAESGERTKKNKHSSIGIAHTHTI